MGICTEWCIQRNQGHCKIANHSTYLRFIYVMSAWAVMEYAGNLSGIEVFQMGFLTIKEDTKEHGRKVTTPYR